MVRVYLNLLFLLPDILDFVHSHWHLFTCHENCHMYQNAPPSVSYHYNIVAINTVHAPTGLARPTNGGGVNRLEVVAMYLSKGYL